MKKLQLISVLLFFLILKSMAQGDKYFNSKQYQAAIATYQQEVKAKPDKYLNLAKSYFAEKDFENAIAAMKEYKEKFPKADKAYADWFIDILKRSDVEVPMKPIAGLINSSASESVPRISADGNILYFKGADRNDGVGGEDIYFSEKQKDGTWGKPQIFTDLCTESHEVLYSMSADGKFALLFGNYPGSFGGGDMFYSVKTGYSWSAPCNLGGTLNTNKSESHAALTPDGRNLVFISNFKHPGTLGGYDIYVSHLTDKGWTKPQNLGSKVNTKEDEVRPSFAADGKTMYFSTEGHFGFGGSDIFMTRRLDDTWKNWSEPVNLGRYINTLQDDEDVSVNAAGTIGYTVKYDEVGAPGTYDIFQFVMPDIARPEKTITLYGTVTNEKDSAAAVNLRFTNLRTNTLQTITPSVKSDGTYSVNLPFEKYLMEINMKGFLYYSQEIDLSDSDKFLPKFTIKDKIGTEKQPLLDSLVKRASMYQQQLKELSLSESADIKGTFEAYQNNYAAYSKTLASINALVLERKYAWLSEDKKYVDVKQDFKVQRATEGAVFKLDNISFDLGKATFQSVSLPSLDNLYEILLKNKIDIELGGHSDSIGSNESNLALSQERVNSVKNYLVKKGIAPNRIVAMGYGEEIPLASNATEEGRAINRRVEVKIIDNSPKGKEGVDENLVEKKVDEKADEQLVKAQVNDNFDMLATLQNAGKIGGLPAGSPCGDVIQTSNVKVKKGRVSKTRKTKVRTSSKRKSSNNNTVIIQGSNNNNYSTNDSFLDFDEFEKSDYIYRPISLGVENFQNFDTPSLLGYNLRFTNRRKLNSSGKAVENNFVFYGKKSNVDFGVGYQYLRFRSLKSLISLPIGYMWGVEGKAFSITNLGNQDYSGYLAIPLGFRGIINIGSLVLNPDVLYNVGLYSSDAARAAGLNSNYFTVGLTTRWKLLYGGVQLNAGSSISYFGVKAGITF